jgi:uncharacterized membrane protein YraQ (UPF0718 family)
VYVVALLVGLVFGMQTDARELLVGTPSPARHFCETNLSEGTHPRRKRDETSADQISDRFAEFVGHAFDEFFEMGRYLVLGAALAAGLQTFVPRTALLAVGNDPVWSVAAMMLLAVLLSVCSTVDAFVALSFVGTFTTGALVAFLVFGPMVDLKSSLMYTTTLRRPAVILLVVLCAQFVFLIGASLNLFVRW